MAADSPAISSISNDDVTGSNPSTTPFGETNDTTPKRRKKKVSLNILDDTHTDSTSVTNQPKFKDLDHDPNDVNILARIIDGIRLSMYNLVVKNQKLVKYIALVSLFLLYNAYFITAIAYNRRNEIPWDWCDGHGLLIILTAVVYWSLFYYHVLKRFWGKSISQGVIKPVADLGSKIFSKW